MEVLIPNFAKRGGLVTVVTQEVVSNQVLMVAYTDEAGYLETLRTGKATYFSTSRKARWCKGETSGNYQLVRKVLVDCDGDAIIYQVEQMGEGACHTGAETCFYRTAAANGLMCEAPGAGEKERLPTRDIEVCSSISIHGLFHR